jgi:protein SCO1/2
VTGAGLVWYFENEKKRMHSKRIAEANKGVGRPKVGGAFDLVDQNGNRVTDQDLKGRYSLVSAERTGRQDGWCMAHAYPCDAQVYFGFTHCPDICPEELDKMASMFNLVEQQRPGVLTPVFVTCDPARDGPKELKEYLLEFHPKFLGLTGTYDQIKAMCKAYRVYFSTPTEVQPGQDYLVDHSIYFYLMDPEGDFVEALGRQHSPDQAAKVIVDHMKEWKGPLKTG